MAKANMAKPSIMARCSARPSLRPLALNRSLSWPIMNGPIAKPMKVIIRM